MENDPEFKARCERREAVVRRASIMMGIEYHQSPVWTALRRIVLADAVAIGVDKLESLLDRIEDLERQVVQLVTDEQDRRNDEMGDDL